MRTPTQNTEKKEGRESKSRHNKRFILRLITLGGTQKHMKS